VVTLRSHAAMFDARQGGSTGPNHTASSGAAVKMVASGLNVYYGDHHAIKDANLEIRTREVLAFMGPSGCGKSTFLRCLNRMNDTIRNCRVTGQVLLDGEGIYAKGVDPVQVRARVGMVFQKPNPFPKSVFDNIAFGPKINGLASGREALQALVESSLRRAGLWEEIKDRLQDSGTALSGGQQQRLCIARAIALNPEVLLMDEPCSSLDPQSTARIEGLIAKLREQYTIVIVTHNTQQALRVAQRVAFFYEGEIVEVGSTYDIFNHPRDERTRDYVKGLYG
jgi:phosphate transport system ATP-binding protein